MSFTHDEELRISAGCLAAVEAASKETAAAHELCQALVDALASAIWDAYGDEPGALKIAHADLDEVMKGMRDGGSDRERPHLGKGRNNVMPLRGA